MNGDVMENRNANDVQVTTMPTTHLAEKFRNMPAGFAFLAFDNNGTIHLVMPESVIGDNGRINHEGALTARIVFNLCGNRQIAKLISEAISRERNTVVDSISPQSLDPHKAAEGDC
jgi:hypothetical protein